jgi:hypothetical protein
VVGLSSTGVLPPEQQFTLIVNTFKRPDNLKAAIRHYQTCAGVAAIRVVWSEQVTQPVVPRGNSFRQGAFWDLSVDNGSVVRVIGSVHQSAMTADESQTPWSRRQCTQARGGACNGQYW